jgi:hypothetical protein
MINKRCSLFLLGLIIAVTAFFPKMAHAAVGDSLANSIQQRSELIQETFQKELFDASKPQVGDDLSALMPLMAFLMLINLFSTLYKKGPDHLLLEMAKMGFWAVMAGSIMGGAFYQSTGLGSNFSINTSICKSDFNYKGGISLDRDVFNFVKYAADEFSCALFRENVNHKYNLAVADMFLVLTDLAALPQQCMADAANTTGAADSQRVLDCIHEFKAQSVKTQVASQCGTSLASVTCYMAQILNVVYSFGIKTVVQILVVCAQIATQIMQFMMMFALIIGISGSLLMFKLISPFLVMESVRGRVLAAAKVPMAVAFYGFTQKALLFFIAGLMNAVTTASLVCFAKFGANGDADAVLVVYLIVAIACIALMAMQIVILFKVPKVALSLVNLSLHELVNIGGEMVKAAFGMSTALGLSVATGGLGMAVGAAAGAAGSTAKGLFGGLKALTGLGGFGQAGFDGEGGGGTSSPMVSRGGRNALPGYRPPDLSGSSGTSAGGPQGPTPSSPSGSEDNGFLKEGSSGDDPSKKKAGAASDSSSVDETAAAAEKTRKEIRLNARRAEGFDESVARVAAEEKWKQARSGKIKSSSLAASELSALSRSDLLSPDERKAAGVAEMEIPQAESAAVSDIAPVGDVAPILPSETSIASPDSVSTAPILKQNLNTDTSVVSAPSSNEAASPAKPGAQSGVQSASASVGSPSTPNRGESTAPQGPAANPRARRQTRSNPRSQDQIQTSSVASAQNFDEFQNTKDRFDKNDSPAQAARKKAQDAIYGTFGTSEGRKHFAKKAALGGARVLRQLILDSLSATPGNEMSLGGLSAGNSDFKAGFDNEGQKRYSEFREMVEGEERKRLQSAEVGLQAANESEAIPNTIRDNYEHEEMMLNLEAVISGAADDATREKILREVEGGVQSLEPDQAEEVRSKYAEALEANDEFRNERMVITENSAEFSKYINFISQKRELSNSDVEQTLKMLSLPINESAIAVYTTNKARIEALLKAELLKSTNVKIKR